jgi:hypothetical protein
LNRTEFAGFPSTYLGAKRLRCCSKIALLNDLFSSPETQKTPQFVAAVRWNLIDSVTNLNND